ncbi:MAG TPA: XTP/dITP diphosphatase [Syntrophomonadaceae bacterium]|nr:XTP/dITP diphosphatase [Syntrophomonadaceae bacterium]HOQ09488.1 XTP/dITP diphosphatase [Syntrophomonadaceae bacterium]HPU48438.1 XTP/dITP diphosphatase [Syntrophomonadaceae bacterium]
MRKQLLLATRNRHKKRELQELLADMEVEILTLEDVDPIPEVVEDGETFEANAVKKARATAMAAGILSLADDSGLEVDALQGKPGVYSARFAGEHATDEENNAKLLKLMESVPDEKRTARFVSVIAICDPQGHVETVRGECKGTIARIPAGNGGFGYDPLFIPQGYEQTYAQLSAEEKNRISHRGVALAKAVPVLKAYFAARQS